jgi:hypothetical protein
VKSPRRLRAFIAWCAACALATAAHVFGSSAVLLSDTMGLSVLLSGPALMLLTPRARAQEWRRPGFDIALFAACALVLPALLSIVLATMNPSELFRAAADLETSGADAGSAAFMGLNSVLALASGAIGGFAYWLFSGAPRPPY